MKRITYILLSLVIITSCVSKRKLTREKMREETRVSALRNDSTNTHNKLADCYVTTNTLQNENSSMKADLQNLNASIDNSEKTIANSNQTIAKSKMTIADQAKRLNTLEGLIQSQRDVMNKLKGTISDALVNFKPDELSVTLKDGKLYVSLQEKLLFKSGSAVVDPKGIEALQTLATVLNSNPDINITIEGHTDNVPIHGKLFEDNWALSVARATAIVRVLTVTYGVDAHRVIASGRSQFYPVDDNTTVDGRAKNRRTEIVLTPDLTSLFKLLNQ